MESEIDDDTAAKKMRERQDIAEKMFAGFWKTVDLPCATIFKVPEELRKLKESAYTPHRVSIGLLHSDDPHLKSSTMQDVKQLYALHLLYEVAPGSQPEAQKKRQDILVQCIDKMQESIVNASKSYAQRFVWLDKELDKQMLLFDGFFILQVLYSSWRKKENQVPYSSWRGKKNANEGGESSENKSGSDEQMDQLPDPIFDSSLTYATVQLDLLLLENQIPFFVLDKLFRLTLDQIPHQDPSCRRPNSLTDYILLYFRNLMNPPEQGKPTNTASATNCRCLPRDCVLSFCGNTMSSKEEEGPRGEGKKSQKLYNRHILQIIRDNYFPGDPPEGKAGRCDFIMPCASELEYAGVKFVPGSGQDLFAVEFTEPTGLFWWCRRAPFEIPKMTIGNSTEPLLRNIIAYEQCSPGVPGYFTSYAVLMDMLVNSEKDVRVLKKAGIIDQSLGTDEEACGLINKLCMEIVVGEFFFAETCRQAAKYSNRCWPRNIAHVKHTYFASPWTFIAFCVGFIAFAITVTQFVLSWFDK